MTDMDDMFSPTHMIRPTGGEPIPVQLVDGAAYTREEWLSQTSADYERDDQGRWTRQGQPFDGEVVLR